MIEQLEKMINLKLHAEIQITDLLYARRVPTGWIYTEYTDNGQIAMCFVPGPPIREPIL